MDSTGKPARRRTNDRVWSTPQAGRHKRQGSASRAIPPPRQTVSQPAHSKPQEGGGGGGSTTGANPQQQRRGADNKKKRAPRLLVQWGKAWRAPQGATPPRCRSTGTPPPSDRCEPIDGGRKPAPRTPPRRQSNAGRSLDRPPVASTTQKPTGGKRKQGGEKGEGGDVAGAPPATSQNDGGGVGAQTPQAKGTSRRGWKGVAGEQGETPAPTELGGGRRQCRAAQRWGGGGVATTGTADTGSRRPAAGASRPQPHRVEGGGGGKPGERHGQGGRGHRQRRRRLRVAPRGAGFIEQPSLTPLPAARPPHPAGDARPWRPWRPAPP